MKFSPGQIKGAIILFTILLVFTIVRAYFVMR